VVALVAYEHFPVPADQEGGQCELAALAVVEPEPVALEPDEQLVEAPLVFLRQLGQGSAATDAPVPLQPASVGIGEQDGVQPVAALYEPLPDCPGLGALGERSAALQVPVAAHDTVKVADRGDLELDLRGVDPERF